MHSGLKRLITKIFKVAGWIALSIVVLLVALILLIQLPAVQLTLTRKAVSFLEKKIGTKVALKSIHIAFPKDIVLEGIYLEDQKGDTLLYAGRFAIDTDLWALTKHEIQLNDIQLENAVAFINRPERDSAFNFTYIMKAFAGDSTAVPDTLEQKNWDFSLETIALKNIRLDFRDLLEGNTMNVSLGEFELTMDEFDLYNNRFGVAEILLANTRAVVQQSKVPVVNPVPQEAQTDSTLLDLSLKKLNLDNIHLNYEQIAMGQVMRLDLGEARVESNDIDLAQQKIDLKEVTLKKTFIAYQQLPAASEAAPGKNNNVQQKKEVANPWKISLTALDFADNSLQYYDFTKPEIKNALDFNHLWITSLTVDLKDVVYDNSDLRMNLRNLSFHEKSGFAVQTFKGNVAITETSATLKDFLLQTANSRLQLRANATFPSFTRLRETYGRATVSADIHESSINVKDVLYFDPQALDSLPVNLPAGASLRIDAAVNGTVNELAIDHLIFRALSDTQLRASGTIAGLPDANHVRLNIALNKLYTTKADIQTLLPDTLLPDSIAIPGWLNLEGRFKGTPDRGLFSTMLTSDMGAVDLKGQMNLDSASALRGYDATLTVNELNIGNILMKPDSVMGTLTMNADLHSAGLSMDEMNSDLTAFVEHFEYNNYRYSDFKLKGRLKDKILTAEATLTDKNLDFTFTGDYNYQREVPRYNFTLDLKNADFQKLNLAQRPLKARGTLQVNMVTSDFRVLNGNVGVRKVALFDGDHLYAVDSLLFASIDQEGRSEINIDSDLLTAKFEGSINLFALPGVVREYFNTYYSLHDSLDVKDAGRQHFSFDIQLKNTDLLTGILVPKLTSFVPGKIVGEFDSEAQKLDLRMEINEIQYANIGVKSFVFSTNSDRSALHYNFIVDRIMVDSMRVDGLEFNGTVANDSIRTDLIVLDSLEQQKYVLAGTFFSRENAFDLSLAPDRIKLNYQNWKVPADNFIRFGGKKLVAHNVQLVNGREKIIIESNEQAGSPLFIGFRELDLEYLSSMIAQHKPLSGLLHGDINLYPDPAGMTFTSDLHIGDFRISDVAWGDVSLAVEQEVKNRFDINFGISGNENNISAKGYYTAGEKPGMSIAATIERFNLATLAPLVAGQLKDLKGGVSGHMDVGGTPEKPNVDGSIRLHDTHFLSTYLNSPFSINDETILFNDRGIRFNQFQITDNNKNEARIDGMILTKTFRDFSFDLTLNTNHFRLFNTTAKDNDLFYGKLDIEAKASIRGDMNTPVVDMTIGLSDDSDLTYVVPQSEASVMEAEGIVKFVDKTFKGDPFMNKISNEVADTVKSTFTGIDLTAKLELTDRERMTIIIDPVTKDQLAIKGNATLMLKIDPTGDIQLSGRYEISEGTYNLSFYKFVKREFAIEKGSTITWSGDPLNAQMDIRAIFKVETPPIELFANQLTGSDATEVNQYKQTLPFLVYLKISGELLQPDIAFQLEMPMEERNAFGGNVYARIQDINTRESDLNKQVFALLILKRFIADNPFENQGATGFEGTARSSVSRILSEQLNRLSEKVKGVELSFDIKSYEDYSSGQAEGQTELQLGFSKTLLHDRLVVKLSGNIDVEGQNTNREPTDYIGDIALEYKLTTDGRFRITGFRNSNYDMIDGELTETGAGLIYVKDYNTLSELFKANAKNKN